MHTPVASSNTTRKHSPPEIVQQAFHGYPTDAQATLLAVRELVIIVAQNDQEIGELQEVLRWGELSFLTAKPKTGSIVRLALTSSGKPALFFHCRTTLVETFRTQYSHLFDFEGNRALVLRLPVEETIVQISHCIRQALRYNRDAQVH